MNDRQRAVMINYSFISDAVAFYEALGYEYVAVPWVVDREPYKATQPPLDARGGAFRDYETIGGYLVASGEQSFLHMMHNNIDFPNKAVCVTPCFRDENHKETHYPYFMKVELCNQTVSQMNVNAMVNEARSFFEKYIDCKVVATEAGFDIESLAGIELGSYGIRGNALVYGTGVAEPRLTYALGLR